MVDEFSKLKRDFNKKFVKQGHVDDLDLGLFWGWIIKNFVPVEALVRQGVPQPVQTAGSWIKIEDETPEYMQCVIVCDLFGQVKEAQYTGDTNLFSIGDHYFRIRKWMTLPQA
ncbi:MAG: hypothetical protein KKH44_07705 [Bacteroidetes bacterium]|nr:hypothetical protein [Bacteroidota bacterium]